MPDNPFQEIHDIVDRVDSKDPTLLAFAKDHGFRVTSGFSHGGHNTGSKHYQGSASNPGAIDIDNHGINLGNLRKLAAQDGFVVRDETSHPAGQAVWTGPHYHLEKASGPNHVVQMRAPQPHASSAVAAPVIQLGQTVVPLPSAPNHTNLAQHIQMAAQPVHQVPNDVPAPPASQKGGTFGDIYDMLNKLDKPDPNSGNYGASIGNAAPVAGPPRNITEGLGNIANAIGEGAGNALQAIIHPQGLFQMAGQGIGTQLQTSGQTSANPLDVALNLPTTQLGIGALHGGVNLANSLYDLPGSVADAYNNRPHETHPLIPTQLLDQNAAKNPGFDFAGQAIPYVAADLLTGGEAAAPEAAGLAEKLNAVQLAGNTLKHAATGAAFGALGAPGSVQDRASGAVQMGLLSGGLGAGGEVLANHFRAPTDLSVGGKVLDSPRQLGPEPVYLDSDLPKPQTEADLNRNLGVLTQRAKEADAAKAAGLEYTPKPLPPDPQIEATNTVDPISGKHYDSAPKNAMSSAPILRAGEADLSQASDIIQMATERNLKAEQAAQLATGESDPVMAQRQLGQRIIAGDPESRTLLDEVLSSRKDLMAAHDLGADIQNGITRRDSLPEPVQLGTTPPEPVQMGATSEAATPRQIEAPPAPTTDPSEQLNPEKPRSPELLEAAQKQGYTLQTAAEIEQFLRKYQPDQLQHFLNAVEAGRNNQTVSVAHSPLEEGGRVTNTREVSPVDFALKKIAPNTEVRHLRTQFEGDDFAVRDNLVQRLQQSGVTVNAADQRIEGLKPLTVSRRLNQLAGKLPEHRLTHAYIVDHNFGETAREGPFGFRRMDRISDSSLTGNKQPVELLSENKIAPAFQAFRDLVNSETAPPALKRVSRQLDRGNMSARSFQDLKNAYASLSDADLAALCKRIGL